MNWNLKKDVRSHQYLWISKKYNNTIKLIIQSDLKPPELLFKSFVMIIVSRLLPVVFSLSSDIFFGSIFFLIAGILLRFLEICVFYINWNYNKYFAYNFMSEEFKCREIKYACDCTNKFNWLIIWKYLCIISYICKK